MRDERKGMKNHKNMRYQYYFIHPISLIYHPQYEDFTFFEIVVKIAMSWLHSSCNGDIRSAETISESTNNSNQ